MTTVKLLITSESAAAVRENYLAGKCSTM